MIKKNVGKIDSRIRYFLGTIALILAILGFSGTLGLGVVLSAVLVAFGLTMFVTGRSKTCGIYSVLDIDTSEKEKGSESS